MVNILRFFRRSSHQADADLEDLILDERRRAVAQAFRLRLTQTAARGHLLIVATTAAIIASTDMSRTAFIVGILVALLAAFVAGTGTFLATRDAIAVQQAAIDQLRGEMTHEPEETERGLEVMLRREGVSSEGASMVTRIIAIEPESWLRTLMEKRFGLTVDAPAHQIRDALLIFAATMVSALLPAFPFGVLAPRPALTVMVILAAIVLAFLGAVSGLLARRNPALAALEWLVAGVVAGVGGYLLGAILTHIV